MNVISRLLLRLLLKSMKGGVTVVIVMASLIIYGDITFEQVPTSSQKAVKDRLEILGYDTDGKPLGSE